MAEQKPIATKPATRKTVTEPSGGFAPHFSTHPVATLTLGRQAFNDSDKANYFEG